MNYNLVISMPIRQTAMQERREAFFPPTFLGNEPSGGGL